MSFVHRYRINRKNKFFTKEYDTKEEGRREKRKEGRKEGKETPVQPIVYIIR